MTRYLYNFILAAVIIYIQYSVLAIFSISYNINLILVFVVFMTVVFGFNNGLIFALFIGLLINIYTFLPFGSALLILIAIVLLTNFLYKNVFSNFSFFTNLILILIATVTYNLLVVLIAYFAYVINLTGIYIVVDQQYFYRIFWQIILNLILISVLYLIAKTTIKNLNLSIINKNGSQS